MPGKALKLIRTIGRREIALYYNAEREKGQAEAAAKSGAGPIAEAVQA